MFKTRFLSFSNPATFLEIALPCESLIWGPRTGPGDWRHQGRFNCGRVWRGSGKMDGFGEDLTKIMFTCTMIINDRDICQQFWRSWRECRECKCSRDHSSQAVQIVSNIRSPAFRFLVCSFSLQLSIFCHEGSGGFQICAERMLRSILAGQEERFACSFASVSKCFTRSLCLKIQNC